MNIHALVLAAGRSQRFAGNKLLQTIADKTCLLDRCINNLHAASINFTIVVSPANIALQQHCATMHYNFIINPHAERGMGSSLAYGVKSQADVDGWLIVPADMPAVLPVTIAAVISALQKNKIIVAPCYQQRQGHPVGFAKVLYEELIQLDGDQGARAILHAHLDLLHRIDVIDSGILFDVDTPEDLQKFISDTSYPVSTPPAR